MSRNDKARLRRRSIGYVFQDFNLLAGLTAVENVSLPLELDGIVGARRHRPRGWPPSRSSGSPTGPTHFPDELSGGERQRVAIARAVVGERHLLLADEPSGALDSANGEAVMRMILAACKRGVAAVVVTHDAQLASWADRVVFLRDGRIVDQTVPPPSPESLLEPDPANTMTHRRPRTARPTPSRRPTAGCRPAGRRPLGLAALPARVASAVPDPRAHHRRRRGDDRGLGGRDEQPAAGERRLRYGAGRRVLHDLRRAHRERSSQASSTASAASR